MTGPKNSPPSKKIPPFLDCLTEQGATYVLPYPQDTSLCVVTRDVEGRLGHPLSS